MTKIYNERKEWWQSSKTKAENSCQSSSWRVSEGVRDEDVIVSFLEEKGKRDRDRSFIR